GNGIVVVEITTSALPGVYNLDISAPGMAAVHAETSGLASEVRTIEVRNQDQTCGDGCPVNQYLPQPYSLRFLDANGDGVKGVITQWKIISGDGLLSKSTDGGYEASIYSMESAEDGKAELYHKLGT